MFGQTNMNCVMAISAGPSVYEAKLLTPSYICEHKEHAGKVNITSPLEITTCWSD